MSHYMYDKETCSEFRIPFSSVCFVPKSGTRVLKYLSHEVLIVGIYCEAAKVRERGGRREWCS